MREKRRRVRVIMALTMFVSAPALSQGPLRTLVVAGHAGSVPVTQLRGKSYVEVEALADAAGNGSQPARLPVFSCCGEGG